MTKTRFPALCAVILIIALMGCGKSTSNGPATVSDADGNVYKTVTIGTQTWMAENLRVRHYRNGDAIPNITQDSVWSNLSTGACCDYDNNAGNSSTYGCFYNWHAAADSRNICPAGWHMPSDSEWTVLSTYLGGVNTAGGSMKSTTMGNWMSPNMGASNSCGFSALPGGNRNFHGAYSYMGSYAIWWAATAYDPTYAYYRSLRWDNAQVDRGYGYKTIGYSVRCVKD
jgi:uncharacterized protein (TIGR02145 family)